MIAYDDVHVPCSRIWYIWDVFDCFVALWRKYANFPPYPAFCFWQGVCCMMQGDGPQLSSSDADVCSCNGPQGQTVRITVCPQQYLGDATATTSKDYPMRITIHHC